MSHVLAFLAAHQGALLVALNVIAIAALYVTVCHRDPFDPPKRRR